MMKMIAVLIAVLVLSSSADASNHCTPPRQPPGTGNSLMTWHIPRDCPLTREQRAAKARCQLRTGHAHVGATACNDGSRQSQHGAAISQYVL